MAARRRADPLATDEAALLKTYRLSTLNPSKWEDLDAGALDDVTSGGLSTSSGKLDEPDPLALKRGGTLTGLGQVSPELRANVLLQSKAFDPKVFLSTVHPHATFKDLSVGRDRLRDALEQRSEALKVLVEEEFDRFANVKGTTMAVFDEMREGPLADDSDFGVKGIKESLRLASAKAEQVYNPILEARLKADRLRSTLSVFERNKFFFNLPGVLIEAIEAGRYDTALRAYRRGRDMLDAKPEKLLGLQAGATVTPQQHEQAKRIHDKVWIQVERIIGDLRTTLGKRLRDTRRNLDEVEKTIEVLLELDPKDDPVWIFFDTQHHRILQSLRTSHSTAYAKYKGVMLRHGAAQGDTLAALDLRACVASLSSLEPNLVYERAAGATVWKAALEVIKTTSETLLASLPSFWKVARGYMSGKYQKRDSSNASVTRRSPAQCRTMTSEIVALYISLLSDFFELNAPAPGPLPEGQDPPLPGFVPPATGSMTAAFYLARIIADLNDVGNDLGGLALLDTDNAQWKTFIANLRSKVVDVVCQLWTADAKQLWRLENWVADPDEPSTTLYLRRAATFQRTMARNALVLAGGAEDRGVNAYGAPTRRPSTQDEALPPKVTEKIHAAYINALYGFLDGLVHVAFSQPETLDGEDSDVAATLAGRNINVNDVDTRIMLTTSNLSHLKAASLAKMVQQFESSFHVDLKAELQTLLDVVNQLDKILFDDFVKRKSAEIAAIFRKGVLTPDKSWFDAPKPTEVHPYIYEALLSLVLVHAQISAVASPLVHRTLSALVDELATEALDCFKRIERFGMGGMLQATLEIEFLHQTLEPYVSKGANAKLQEVYGTISAACYRQPGQDGGAELQQELEQLRRTLATSKRATSLDFLCFRTKSAFAPARTSTPAPPQARSTPASPRAPTPNRSRGERDRDRDRERERRPRQPLPPQPR